MDFNIHKPTATRKVSQITSKEKNEESKLIPDIPNHMKINPLNLLASSKSENPYFVNTFFTDDDKSFSSQLRIMAKRQGSAFNTIIKRKNPESSEQHYNSSSVKSTTLCYEILVNSILKIFHHPSISLLPLKDRLHFAITQWPFIWILYLCRKTSQNETKVIMQKLIDPPITQNLSPASISALLCLINSLCSLSLDQAEHGLIETILISKVGRQGR